MSIFDYFKKSKTTEQAPTPTVTNEVETQKMEQEIKEEDFIDKSDPKESNKYVSYSYISKMPIDLIYQYLKDDYETKGYEDALCNPDRSYKEMNKILIRSNLEVMLRQVNLKYKTFLSEIDSQIEARQQSGLIDVVDQLKSKSILYKEHLRLLQEMDNDLINNKPYMVGMLLSYERGFLRGLAALSMEVIKNQEA